MYQRWSHNERLNTSSPNDSSSSRGNRVVIYSGLLIGLTILALFFYALFKPSNVILNRLLSRVVTITPILTEHDNVFVDTFIQTFGDFISVIMMFMILAIIVHLLKFPFNETKELFQWIIIPFILFECLQLVGIGNFYIRDLFAYALGYQLGFYIINRVENTKFTSLFENAFIYLLGKKKEKNDG